MVTKGLIKTINYVDNTCFVRMPYFEQAGGSEIFAEATFSIQPGSYNGYKEGDCVLVAFEDGLPELPVVIGKLYLGASTENKNDGGSVRCQNLQVSNDAEIPLSTRLSSSKDAMNQLGQQFGTIADLAKAIQKLTVNGGENADILIKQSAEQILDQVTEKMSKVEIDVDKIRTEVATQTTQLTELGETISKQQSTIEQTDSKIAMAVSDVRTEISEEIAESTDEIDKKITEVDQKMSELTIASDSISTSVSEIKETMETSGEETAQRFEKIESSIEQTSDEIEAKVKAQMAEGTEGGNESSFAWSLTTDGFKLKAQDNTVFFADQEGNVTISGYLEQGVGDTIDGLLGADPSKFDYVYCGPSILVETVEKTTDEDGNEVESEEKTNHALVGLGEWETKDGDDTTAVRVFMETLNMASPQCRLYIYKDQKYMRINDLLGEDYTLVYSKTTPTGKPMKPVTTNFATTTFDETEVQTHVIYYYAKDNNSSGVGTYYPVLRYTHTKPGVGIYARLAALENMLVEYNLIPPQIFAAIELANGTPLSDLPYFGKPSSAQISVGLDQYMIQSPVLKEPITTRTMQTAVSALQPQAGNDTVAAGLTKPSVGVSGSVAAGLVVKPGTTGGLVTDTTKPGGGGGVLPGSGIGNL